MDVRFGTLHASIWQVPKRVSIRQFYFLVLKSCTRPWLVLRAWREMVEHFLHVFIEIFYVFLRLVRKSVASCSSPNQALALGVEKINNKSADLIGLRCGSRISESSTPESSPAPTSSEAVVEGIESLLVLGHFYRYNRDLAASWNPRPPLGRQSRIDSVLDSTDP